MIIGIRPKASEFKAIAGFFFFGFAAFGVLDGVKAGAVGIIFGVGAIGNDENLHVFKEATASPEGVPLVALDLVKSLIYGLGLGGVKGGAPRKRKKYAPPS